MRKCKVCRQHKTRNEYYRKQRKTRITYDRTCKQCRYDQAFRRNGKKPVRVRGSYKKTDSEGRYVEGEANSPCWGCPHLHQCSQNILYPTFELPCLHPLIAAGEASGTRFIRLEGVMI